MKRWRSKSSILSDVVCFQSWQCFRAYRVGFEKKKFCCINIDWVTFTTQDLFWVQRSLKDTKKWKMKWHKYFFFRICHYTDDIWLGHWSNGLAISEVNISLLFNIMSIRRGTGTNIEICEIKKDFNNNWSLVTFHQNQLFGLKFPYTIR